MTIEDVKKKYGSTIHCSRCPLNNADRECTKGEYEKFGTCAEAILHWELTYNAPPVEETTTENDVVSHPTHYTNGGMECIDEMIMVFGKEAVANFCLCNVWKYRYRALSKNGEEDIKKSHWYMAKYKELTERCTHGTFRKEDDLAF